jgi:antitoxin (DNA-binding transcriptional repressor) of toxin-antitoxin stability system
MIIVSTLKAKFALTRLIDSLERGAEKEIVIARNGKPAARLVPISKAGQGVRFGLAEGMFNTPEPDPALEEEAAALFRKSKA